MTKYRKYNTLVFIGRFQPLHNGHIDIIEKAAVLAEKVLVLCGSTNCARSPKNPWTYEERKSVIEKSCQARVEALGAKLLILPLDDFMYNDNLWVAQVQKILTGRYLGEKVGLIGFSKDHSSYYLKMFPGMEHENVSTQWGTLNATNIRENYFQRVPGLPDKRWVPQAQIDFMDEFAFIDEFKWLLNEAEFYREYPKIWGNRVHPCADNLVLQSGHILLVERKDCPGKGLLALPGGHIKVNERFIDAAVRELIEETEISDGYSKKGMPPAVLKGFIKEEKLFDDPDRSLCGRIITMAYKYELPARTELYHVKGNDDAAYAQWVKLGDIDPKRMFEDHYHIIQTMTS